MLKKKYKRIIIAGIFFLIILPFVMNVLYYPHNLLVSIWEPGDILTYYGSVLIGIATVYLGFQANSMNKRLIDNEMISHKPFVNISKDKIQLKKETISFEGYILDIKFEPISLMPIVGGMAYKSKMIGIDGTWNEKNTSSFNVISIDSMQTLQIKDNYISMRVILKEKNLPENIFSIKIKLTNIYGFKTEQYVNLRIVNEQIIDTSTIAIL